MSAHSPNFMLEGGFYTSGSGLLDVGKHILLCGTDFSTVLGCDVPSFAPQSIYAPRSRDEALVSPPRFLIALGQALYR
jgi:hypothetical protein